MASTFTVTSQTTTGSAAASTSFDVVATAPSIAEGDLIVAFCFKYRAGSYSTPTGFTQVVSVTKGGSPSVGNLAIFAKIASASDAAASDFTFTAASDSGGPDYYAVTLCGINSTGDFSGAISSLIVSDSDSAGTLSSSRVTWTGGVTPNYANSLVMMAVIATENSGTPTPSSPAVTNSNPTWTTVNSGTEGGALGHLVSKAVYSPATATGDYSAGTGSSIEAAGAILSIYDSGDASGTTTHLSVSPAFYQPNGTAGSSGTTEHLSVTPTLNQPTATAKDKVWSNETRTSTTWTNDSRL